MNAVQQLLTDHIDIWTAAETEKKSGRGRASGSAASVYGIKKLRELILELAVRGILVPQDASDEPASELFKRIQIEKAKLITEDRIRKEKSFDPISNEEIPFQLPQEWKWVRIGQIGHDWGQKLPDRDFTYIEVSAIDNQRGVISSAGLVTPENAPSRARKLVKNGTLIYSTIRPYLLNIAVVEEDFFPEPIASTAFAVVHPFCAMPPRYFLFFLRSPVFVRYVESVQMGIAYPAINDRQFFSGLIPLPPLAEQHRIVAKVDELMALCDQLEAQHSNAADAHEQLVSHLLGTLTQSQSAADFNANWQRIAAHFDALFTTETSIDVLKQTLLQLAVMGKLVAQDDNDEPASQLFKRIQAEKARLIAQGKIKKEKVFAKISRNNMPFELPPTWEWAHIGELAQSTDYGLSEQTFDTLNGIPVLKMGDIQNGKIILGGQKKVDANTEGLSDLYLKTGDLLYNRTNSAELVGKTGIFQGADAKYTFASYLIRIRCFSDLFSPSYLNFAMNTPLFRKTQIDPHLKQQCGQANVNGTIMKNMIVPFPALAEQRRICAKVDEMMALCDQLKSHITNVNQHQKNLADVLVDHAVNG